MGLKYVLDTKVILFHFGGRLANPLPLPDSSVSIMSRIELLSYPDISGSEERKVRDFLRWIPVFPLLDDVAESAIRLRRGHRLRVPDAVIAATAEVLGATLLTNDRRLLDFPGVPAREARLIE